VNVEQQGYFKANPDLADPRYETKFGIYEPNCGLDQLQMSFGHDGNISEAMKNYLPMEALYMLRHHSFYAWHRHGAYDHLCNKRDREMLQWVHKFNLYNLYSKGHTKPNLRQSKPFYDDLFAEFFPAKIDW
jgi:inositol oxygenase